MTPGSSNEIAQEHRAWVEAWNETSFRAAASPLNQPLTEDAKDAYRMLPEIIANCERLWEMLPESDRTMHPLMLRSS
jgi:hypothetical protein